MNSRFHFAFLLWLSVLPATMAQTTTQTFDLQSGWNSIWLELAPTNTAIEQVFAGLPVESVWTFRARQPAVEYIQDLDEPVWNRDQWLSWVPAGRIEAMHNNLFHAFGHRPYLVKLTTAATLVVTGVPSLRKPVWVPDAFNLRGFPIDPAFRPNFLNFFRSSPSHYNSDTAALERIYRLNSTGRWTLVDPGNLMQRGIAYWCFSRGPSEYCGPVGIRIEPGNDLNFGTTLKELGVRLINESDQPHQIRLSLSGSPLVVAERSQTGLTWRPLDGLPPQTVPARGEVQLRFGFHRMSVVGSEYRGVLLVEDENFTRLEVPVSGSRWLDQPTVVVPGQPPVQSHPYAGLWIGSASINAVNQVNAPTNNPAYTNPTPTAAEFSLRLLLHVDRQGTTRLLKEVTQLWQDGTYTNDASGNRLVATPGRAVLVTDDALIPQFRGAALRDGVPVGRRLSTVDYDFTPDAEGNYRRLEGTFGVGGRLTNIVLELPPQHPTHPFRHKYHPDHDNRTADFKNYAEEAYPISREVTFEFTGDPPDGVPSPDVGTRVVGGVYRETVTGLHKTPIRCAGTFTLTRAPNTAELNP